MLRLVLGSPAGGLGINGSDGRSVHASMSARIAGAVMGTDKGEQTNNERAWDAHPFCGSMHLLSSPLTTTVALAATPLSVRYACIGDARSERRRRIAERSGRIQDDTREVSVRAHV